MKVLSKILGAILLLGCLAYISFVFGKYVLSSSLLKSIPKSDRIISTKSPVSSTPPSAQPVQTDGAPRVQMEVMPGSRPSRNPSSSSANTNNNNDNNPSDSDPSTTGPKIKNLNEGEAPPKRRKSHRNRKENSSDNAPEESPSTRKSTSNPAPIRRLYQSEESEDRSPVPRPEKSTSTTSSTRTSKPSSNRSESSANSGDAGSISPVPKPE